MSHRLPAAALLLALFGEGPARAQPPADPPPADDPSGLRVSPALRSTLDVLGASTGVPDGFGYSWTPRRPVRGQPATMGLSNYQIALTTPVRSTDDELLFANGSLRVLDVRSNAILPTDGTPFPRSFWDIQAGGGYVRNFGDGWSWGATLNLGTASDRPFHSLREATLSALAFVRKPSGDRNGWLFYVVSTSNGQLGRNIPVPGVAYEWVTDRLTAVVGFPFVTIDWRPTDEWQFEFAYGAITDVNARLSYHLTKQARLFGGFEWVNQAWFRAGRHGDHRQLFLYEKRLEGGFGWRVAEQLDFSFTGGYAFDRFFVESRGLGFRGRNRTDIAPARFVGVQVELKF
ncbi:MAG: hypothetical protein K2V38_20485 [Gemmataceae bacterium]|nr:hypothetical protein [Gemmataceae bacterium]